MKSIRTILCGWLIAMSAGSFAQVNNIYIGPEGGPGLAVLWGNNNAKQNRKPLGAGTVGYAFQYNFTKIISLRTDISYQRAGVTYAPPPPTSAPPFYLILYHEKFDYMTLPILCRATFGKKVSFFVNAGPYFGVLLREVSVATVSGYQHEIISNNTSANRRFDTGISEGLGILIPIGYMFAASFEARDYTGLYNLNKNQPSGTTPILRNNSTDFIFSFIYKLVLHKASKGKPGNDKPAESY